MPRGIAIETSGRIGSIAAVEAGRIVAEEQFPHGLQHAAGILPIIDRLCRDRSWSPADIEHLYVSIGPGSFTGLRIAITLAKTMALATGVKVVAVPSVEALVHNAPPEANHVIIVLDAKRDQIFTARFERTANGGWSQREPAHLDSLSAMLERAPRPVHLLGEGIPYHEKFISMDDRSIVITPKETWRARAAVVAEIGMTMATHGQFANPDTLTPLYIRLPEAEEKWRAANPADAKRTLIA